MTSAPLPRLYCLGVALAAGLVTVPTGSAQTLVRIGGGSASLELPVGLTVPARLSVSSAGSERVLARTPEFTEVELPMRVASNLAWSLGLALADDEPGTPVLVRVADGTWRALSTQPLAVLSGDEPTEPMPVAVRLRLPAGVVSTSALGLRVSLAPAVGAP